MNGTYTIFQKRASSYEREYFKIIFQYTLMLVASGIAGWILPRFFGEELWTVAQRAVSSHFSLPFSELFGPRAIFHAIFIFFKPCLICIGMVAIFSFSSLNCLISDGVLIYLGMRTGCAFSVLYTVSRGIVPNSYQTSPLCVFLFVLFKLLLIFFFAVYAIQAAKHSYRMRIYSKEGRALFPKKTILALLWHTILCVATLFLLHLLYGYAIYLVSK